MSLLNLKYKTNLLDGEEVSFDDVNFLNSNSLTDDEINLKYDRGETRIVTEQARYPLPSIVGLVESPNYILDPEFQRRHKWPNEKKSRLIESFIINVPIPPVFLYEVEFSYFEVMDGLQRLSTISEFYKDEFKLEGLTEWSELNGKRYSSLPEKIRKGIDRRYLSSIILLQETAREDKIKEEFLKQLVFERLNSGGEELKPQETRNALYNGSFNKICISLSRNKYFCKLWGIPEPTKQELEENKIPKTLLKNPLFKDMADVELVLRFFAYRQLEKGSLLSIERFLDQFLKKGNLLPEKTLKKMKKNFEETIEIVYYVLGEKAFYLQKKKSRNKPSKVLYDPIMYIFSNLSKYKNDLIKNKEEIREDFNELLLNSGEAFEGRYNNKNDVIKRINLIYPIIKKYINI